MKNLKIDNLNMIFNIAPNLGYETNEPNLKEIIIKYYQEIAYYDEAVKYADRYIEQLIKCVKNM